MLTDSEARSLHSKKGIKYIFCSETSGQDANQRMRNVATSWNGRNWDCSKLQKRFWMLTTNSNCQRQPVSIQYFMSHYLKEHPIIFLKTPVSIWIRTEMYMTSKRFLTAGG